MNNRTLEKLLSTKGDFCYFIVESFRSYTDWRGTTEEKKLMFIGLPESILAILREKTLDTILHKEVEIIERCYIDTNIFISPKYPPFQQGIQPFMYAVDVLPVNEIDLTKILNQGFTTVYDVEKELVPKPEETA